MVYIILLILTIAYKVLKMKMFIYKPKKYSISHYSL